MTLLYLLAIGILVIHDHIQLEFSHSRLLFTQYHLEGFLSEGCNISYICEICLQCSCPTLQPQRGPAAVDEMVTTHRVPTQDLFTTSSGRLLFSTWSHLAEHLFRFLPASPPILPLHSSSQRGRPVSCRSALGCWFRLVKALAGIFLWWLVLVEK